jgi:hypothetical protein
MNFKDASRMMNIQISSLILGSLALVFSQTCGLASEPLQLTPGTEAAEYFRLSSGTGKLEIVKDQDGGRLVFAPQPDSVGNSTLMAIIAPQKHFLRSTAEKMSLEFRISGAGSFGIQWRAEQPQSSGYLLLLNQWPNDRGTARLFRTRMLPPSGSMEDDLIGKKDFQRFNGKEWHRLEISTAAVSDGVEITARVSTVEEGRDVVLLKLTDKEYPLEIAGLIAMRFFMQADAEKEASDQMIEVRSFTVEPEMN